MSINVKYAVSKSTLCVYYVEDGSIPQVGDHIEYEGAEYIVTARLYRVNSKIWDIFVKKATHNDVTYM